MTRRETSAEIDVAAADWAVRVDHAPLDPQDQAGLDAWLSGDSRRLGAYARACAVFAHARRAKALGVDFDPDSYDNIGDALAAPADNVEAMFRPDTAERNRHPTRRRVLAWGGSAAAAAAMLGLSWQAAAKTYRTAKGEVRLVPLEDGSSFTLNTDSEVRVHYGSHERKVELARGEALFDVAPDAARPFMVVAGDTRVRAVGTSFTVKRIADAPVEVLVRQGEVEIVRPAATPERVAANVRAVVPPQAATVAATLAPAQMVRELAWREGMLAFEDMPLADAAAEFARYSDVRIVLADPAIGRETVTGLYAANNPRGFARSVALSLSLNATNTSESVTLSR